MKGSSAVAGSILFAVFLTGCGASTSATVSGTRDDVKQVSAKYRTSSRTVTDYRNSCSKGKCKKVRTGSHKETYRQKVRSAKYCVELDNVNGNSRKDDVWYTVSSSVYAKYAAMNEGDRVSRMSYISHGC